MEEIESSKFSSVTFLDFGSGIGGSLEYCEKRFGGIGLGIDNDDRKVSKANELGRNVVLGDILAISGEKVFSYVSMMDFLEHLPSEEFALEVIGKACSLASDFVFIAHPSFEDESYLRGLDFKQYWQDWHNHPTHLMISDIVDALRQNGVGTIELEFFDGALDSSHESVLPISAPTDSHKYNPLLHGSKKLVGFDRPVYRQIRILGRFKDAKNQTTLLSKQSVGLEEDSAQCQDQVATLEVDLRKIMNSTSWKITRPLRKVKDILRKVFRPK